MCSSKFIFDPDLEVVLEGSLIAEDEEGEAAAPQAQLAQPPVPAFLVEEQAILSVKDVERRENLVMGSKQEEGGSNQVALYFQGAHVLQLTRNRAQSTRFVFFFGSRSFVLDLTLCGE